MSASTTIVSSDGKRHVVDRKLSTSSGPVGQPTAAPVHTIMTSHVIAVRDDVSLADVVDVLVNQDVSALPIVDADGKPVGLVSKTDVLRVRSDENLTAGALSRTQPRTLPDDAPLWEAAAVMAGSRLHHVMIIDGEGALVGILSALDVVGWLAKREGWGIGAGA